MKRASLQTRLLVTASIILTIFLGLTGISLNTAFQSSAESAEQGRLEGELYGLLGAAELNPQGKLVMITDLAEPRFSVPESGLVADIVDAQGETVWQSASTLGMSLPPAAVLDVDESRFLRVAVNNEQWFSYSYGLAWIDEQDRENRYSFRVMESPQAFNRQAEQFRHTLIIWLGAAALLLLFVQVFVLRWSLSPLRRIEDELHEVEKGDREQLTEDYPRELNGLAGGLNLLLGNERRHLQRYRNSLADLAHSMKTPLAVLRGMAGSGKIDNEARQMLDKEVGRMNNIVEYQLQKAAVAGRASFTEGVAILPVVERILSSLRKVYHDKAISFQVEVDDAAIFHGEEGDLMEILGNLLDNACKWCRTTVSIRLESSDREHEHFQHHCFYIEDDGPGVAEEEVETLFQRGARGDTQVPGHGIGLSIVKEIVASYGGKLEICRSPAGGAQIKVELTV